MASRFPRCHASEADGQRHSNNKEDAKLSRENGEAALRNEDFEKAARLFRKAARMSPDDSSITALIRLAEQQAEGCRMVSQGCSNEVDYGLQIVYIYIYMYIYIYT